MSKYIEVEKLIAEIKRFRATEYEGNTLGDDVANGALDYVLEEIIPSLQQEQPEVDLEKEIAENLGDVWNDTPVEVKQDMIKYARHFYELGKTARMEESVSVAESPSKTFPRVNDFEYGGSYRH